jgi:hypothetical protein
VGLFLALAAGCGAWLAWSDDLGPLAHLAAAAVLAAGLWGVGALLSRPARGPATDGA